jgi:hypothetical protein
VTGNRDPLGRALATLRDIQPPAELGHRIKSDVERVRQGPAGLPGWLLGLGAVAAAIAIVATGVLIVRPSAGPATVPSASAAVTLSATPDASIAPTGSPRGGLGPDTIAVATREIGMPTKVPVSVGQTILIVAGPVDHEGVSSYLVQHFGDIDRGYRPDGDVAWIRATIIERSVEVKTPTCPTAIDLASVASMQPYERMICFASGDLTFQTVTASDLAVGAKTSRRWISSDGHPDFFTALPVYGLTPQLALPDGGWFDVTGHFDDSASIDCGDAGAVAWCRERFVVTTIKPVPAPVFVMPGTWRATRPPPIDGRTEFGMVWTGREAVIWGGYESSPKKSVFIAAAPRGGAAYDPATDRWRIVPDAPIPGRGSAVMAWTGTEVLVFGGRIGEQARLDGAAWNPVSGRWRTIAEAPFGGAEPVGAWLDGRLYVVTSDAAAFYDPATDRWTLLPAAPIRPGWRNAAVAGGRLFVIAFGDGATPPVEWAVLDPATMTWSHGDAPIDPTEAGIDFAGAGELIVSTDQGATFDPVTETWGTIRRCPGVSAPVWTGGYLVGVTAAWRFDECWQLPPAPRREPPFHDTNGREFPVAVWTGRQYVTWSGGTGGDIVSVPKDGAVFTPENGIGPCCG